MLTQIFIKDLATIACLELNLPSACTMITGETGAGKSIFIEAIELALAHKRGSSNLVRQHCNKAEIRLTFDISHFTHLQTELSELCIESENNQECIIRRIIFADGKSKAFINGTPMSLQFIKTFGEKLFHLHSQHQQQALLNTNLPYQMLDEYAQNHQLLAEINRNYQTIQHLQATHATKKLALTTLEERLELLTFQYEELSKLELQAHEWTALIQDHQELCHQQETLHYLNTCLSALNSDEPNNLFVQVSFLQKQLATIQPTDEKIQHWLAHINAIRSQLTDLESEMSGYLSDSDFDQQRLQFLEQRMSSIYALSRKYKTLPENLFDYIVNLSKQLHAKHDLASELQQLETEIMQAKQQYFASAKKLSLARQNAASTLSHNVTRTIRELSLPHGEFSIQIATQEHKISALGQDTINFLIKTNPEQHLQSLHKIISGGELSRLSLALHLALADQISIPTLIFDEVDTGLSGATAEKIGKLLKKLGHTYQVFCITHQAQIAACGDHHLLVEKTINQGITTTNLRLLQTQEKTLEIARMVAGETITSSSMQYAKAMLAQTD